MRQDKMHVVRLASLLALATLAGCPWFTPILSISPTAQRFDAEEADNTMIISNAGGGTLEWSVSAKPDWLTVTPSSGAITSDSQVIKLQADFTDLSSGRYVGKLALTSNGGSRTVNDAGFFVGPLALGSVAGATVAVKVTLDPKVEGFRPEARIVLLLVFRFHFANSAKAASAV